MENTQEPKLGKKVTAIKQELTSRCLQSAIENEQLCTDSLNQLIKIETHPILIQMLMEFEKRFRNINDETQMIEVVIDYCIRS